MTLLMRPTVRGATAEFLLANSVSLNGTDEYFTRTPSTAGNRKTLTFDCWVKRGALGSVQGIFSAGPDGSDRTYLYFNSSDQLQLFGEAANTTNLNINTTSVFRDTSWMHIAVKLDTVTDTYDIIVNGVTQPTTETTTPSTNADLQINSANIHHIGVHMGNAGSIANYFSGYMAFPRLIDGAAVTPEGNLIETDEEGYIKPLEFAGTTTLDFVSGGTGTTIGDMTASGGIAASFDGNKSQTNTQGSKSTVGLSTSNCTVGKQYSSAKTIGQACLTGTTDRGYASGSYTGSLTIYLKSSDSGIGVSETTHDSVTFNNSNATNEKTLTGDGSSATYWWIEIEGATAELGLMAEVEFYETSTNSFGTNGGVYSFSNSSDLGLDSSVTDATVTPSSSGIWSGETGSFTFTGDDIDSSTANKAIYLTTALTGDFIVRYNGATVNSSDFGLFASSELATLDTTNSATTNFGLENMTDSFWRNCGADQLKYGSTTVDSTVVANGSEIEWRRVGDTISFFDDGVLVHTWTQTYSSGMYFLVSRRSGGIDLNNVTFIQGEGNHFRAVNIDSTNQTSDSPTDSSADGHGNFATLNPLVPVTNGTFSNGNRTFESTTGNWRTAFSTIGMSSGKWTILFQGDTASSEYVFGLAKGGVSADIYIGQVTNSWGYYGTNGQKYLSGAAGAAYGSTFNQSNTVRIEFDADNGDLEFFVDDVSQGDMVTGLTSGPYFFGVSCNSTQATATFDVADFGETPTSGFSALATQNFSAATIPDGTAHFNTVLYTGNGSTQSITSVGHQPDFVWIKNRDAADSHVLTDAVRGATEILSSDATTAETTDADTLTSFDSDGFSLGADVKVNTNTENYVAWCWKANGSGSSNTDGSITSTVSANTTAGFSIVTYTGTGSAGTVGHGLTSAPDMMIVKTRDAAVNWAVYHSYNTSAPETDFLLLNLTNATADSIGPWNDTAPTSSVFSILNSTLTNTNTENYVAYCWHGVEGFSKFGSYIGNGSTDGPFVWCGFRPAFLLCKDTTNAASWVLYDNKRNTYNPVDTALFPDTTNADTAAGDIDFLSNGFKIRRTGNPNNSGATVIYAAFAEQPFQGGTSESTQARAR